MNHVVALIEYRSNSIAAMSSRSSVLDNPLLALFLPSLYIFGAIFSLLQFQVILTLIAKGVVEVKKIEFLKGVVPGECDPSIVLDSSMSVSRSPQC